MYIRRKLLLRVSGRSGLETECYFSDLLHAAIEVRFRPTEVSLVGREHSGTSAPRSATRQGMRVTG
jgi:hypothetical protein